MSDGSEPEVIDVDESCTCDWVSLSQHKISVRVKDTGCPVHAESDAAAFLDEYSEMERDRDAGVD